MTNRTMKSYLLISWKGLRATQMSHSYGPDFSLKAYTNSGNELTAKRITQAEKFVQSLKRWAETCWIKTKKKEFPIKN
jgi:hypothetical protein